MTEQELVELLADAEHRSWARWQAHMFKVCDRLPNGAILISPELVKHWQRQIDTPYAHLSERETQSDRNEVAHILPMIRAFAQWQKAEGRCDYPGCTEPATIHCSMISCTHYVCETHGNGGIEEAGEQFFPLCWKCDGKGWPVESEEGTHAQG